MRSSRTAWLQMSWDLRSCMDLQRRCDPQPPRAPQEEVTLLLSCSLSFLSVSTSLSVLSFLQFCLRLFPLSSLSLWPSSPTCLSPRPPPPSSRLCAASPVTQRLSKASLSFLHQPLLSAHGILCYVNFISWFKKRKNK